MPGAMGVVQVVRQRRRCDEHASQQSLNDFINAEQQRLRDFGGQGSPECTTDSTALRATKAKAAG